MKRKIIPGIIVIIMIPILLNIFIGLGAPRNIQIVGDTSTWLQFYGSYIGGILAAAIGFVTIYQTIIASRIESQERAIQDLERTLANCVSLFDYSRVGIISLYCNDLLKYNDVLKEMDEYYNKVTTVANAWGVIYANSTQPEIQHFQKAYEKCWKILVQRINNVSVLIVEMKDGGVKGREQTWVKIDEIIGKQQEYKEVYLQRLLESAQNWLAEEKRKSNQAFA